MKRKEGITVDQKVIIVHRNGVSEEVRERVRRQYPHALVKVLSASDVIKEAVEYKKKVSRVVFMPEITSTEARGIADCWSGSIPISIDRIARE